MNSTINLFYAGFVLVMVAGIINIGTFHFYSYNGSSLYEEDHDYDYEDHSIDSINTNDDHPSGTGTGAGRAYLETYNGKVARDTELTSHSHSLSHSNPNSNPNSHSHSRSYSDYDMETAIIITTNLIPSHPNIDMLKETIASIFTYIIGLSPNTQIYITVDALIHRGYKEGREKTWAKEGREREQEEERLESYVTELYRNYDHLDNYHIIVNTKNIQLGASFEKAVNLLNLNHNKTSTQTEFIYYVQHDFKFVNVVNHTALVKSMREYPNVLRLVRFHKRPITPSARSRPCWNR